ncbi:ribosome biogenesis protein Ssf2 [Apiospora kogelbergensis]|uniref:ribosome biogenesis protein Ssf2 n=1 Tax=Apiospora kogelbergensis TaxID=1337665 RepID=UPI003131BE73
MAKRRTKRRTHVGAANPESTAATTGHADMKDPKSMVIRIGAGEVGSNISQLAKDVRQVMEPGTASRLKERRANRLRDYVTMTGPLGVTHLMLFSKSDSGNTNLRIAGAPRGPTLHFRVDKYSLCKDKTPLRSIKRVLLLNREPAKDGDDGSFVINFRHYAITTKAVGVSKPLRRLDAAEKLLNKKARKGGVPNLGKLEDISDYMVGGENGDGYMTDATSGSEMDTDAEVEVLDNAPKKVLSQKARAALEASAKADEVDDRVERRAVKMVELGPRMKLRLVKIEDGLSAGKILWHEHIHKSKDELQELEKRWEQRRAEKEKRRKEQKANVDKKKKERAANATKKDDGEDEDEMDLDGNNSDLFDEMMDDDYDSEGLAGAADEAAKEDEWEEDEEDDE